MDSYAGFGDWSFTFSRPFRIPLLPPSNRIAADNTRVDFHGRSGLREERKRQLQSKPTLKVKPVKIVRREQMK